MILKKLHIESYRALRSQIRENRDRFRTRNNLILVGDILEIPMGENIDTIHSRWLALTEKCQKHDVSVIH